jgi:hypothetical protein
VGLLRLVWPAVWTGGGGIVQVMDVRWKIHAVEHLTDEMCEGRMALASSAPSRIVSLPPDWPRAVDSPNGLFAQILSARLIV